MSDSSSINPTSPQTQAYTATTTSPTADGTTQDAKERASGTGHELQRELAAKDAYVGGKPDFHAFLDLGSAKGGGSERSPEEESRRAEEAKGATHDSGKKFEAVETFKATQFIQDNQSRIKA